MAWAAIASLAMKAIGSMSKRPKPKDRAHSRLAGQEESIAGARMGDPMTAHMPGPEKAPPVTEQFASGKMRRGAARRALEKDEAPSMGTTGEPKAQSKALPEESTLNKPVGNNKDDTLVY